MTQSLTGKNGYATAKILAKVVKNLPFNLILTGAQADDDGYGVVGPALAELIGVPHATMVKKVELSGQIARVNRELEGGFEEIVEVTLPAVLAVQTGINEPRYVSIMGTRKAMQKEVKVIDLAGTGLSDGDVGGAGSWIKLEKMYVPPVEKQAEFLKGTPDDVASKIVEILKAKGVI